MDRKNEIIYALSTHLRQWQESTRLIVEQLVQAQEEYWKSRQPSIDALLEAIRSLTKQERCNRLLELAQISQYVLSNMPRLTEAALQFQKFVQVLPPLEYPEESFRDLPPRTQEALLLLGAHGWYFDLEMYPDDLWELEESLRKGNIREVEEAMIKHFESRLDEIEESISTKFPGRQKLIRAAFKAHRRQEYELSIPVLLAQTDGICKEVANQYLFRKHKQNKKPQTAIYVEQMASDAYTAALLSPLAKTLPISASEHERLKDFDELNRHLVLHGESLDYGNKVNGLKAISLISYVTYVLTMDEQKP